MLADLILAILHHLAIVSLIAMLAFESALLRPGITAQNLSRVTRVDAGYGMTAGLVIVIGVCRVIWGIKGAEFYLSNPAAARVQARREAGTQSSATAFCVK